MRSLMLVLTVLVLAVSSPAEESTPAEPPAVVALEKKVAALAVYVRDMREMAEKREQSQRSIIDHLRNRLVLAEQQILQLENDMRLLQDLDRDVQRLDRDLNRVENDVRRLR